MSRAYVPLSVDFFGDDRVLELSPSARLEYIACLCVAKRGERDGQVTLSQVRREQPDVAGHDALLAELVEQGLLARVDGTSYTVGAWLKWNKSAHELVELRALKQTAGQAGGRRSGQVRAKQSASPPRSTVLQDGEAEREPNLKGTEEHQNGKGKSSQRDTPGVSLADAMAAVARGLRYDGSDLEPIVAAQRKPENKASLNELEVTTRRLARACTGNRQVVELEAVDVVSWAYSGGLAPMIIDEVVGGVPDWKTPPRSPHAVAVAIRKRATQLNIHLPVYKAARP